MISPNISVIMPVYNGEEYLKEAIESILNQTFTDFEFIIINDGSTDATLEIINLFEDQRIRLVNNSENKKLIYCLNLGLRLSQGRYIVRMDADDISLPNRFEQQFTFMELHHEIGLSGCFAQRFSNLGYSDIWKFPLTHESIKCQLIWSSAIIHPTLIIRLDLIKKHNILYDFNFLHCEDYHLFTKHISDFNYANIPIILLQYREHANQISSDYKNLQTLNASRAVIEYLRNIEITFSESEANIFRKLLKYEFGYSIEDLKIAESILRRIHEQNNKIKFFDTKILSSQLSERLFIACYFSTKSGLKAYKVFWDSPIHVFFKLSLIKRMKFLFKCFVAY